MESEGMGQELSAGEIARLTTLWDNAVSVKNPSAVQTTQQALAVGVNFRINLVESFKAAWETAQAAVKGVAAAHAPFAVWAWFEVGAEAISAAHSIFSALVQRMQPIEYITAVILAQFRDGLTRDQLKNEVETFLKRPDVDRFAWYLGVNESKIRRAKEKTAAASWFEDVEKKIAEDFITDDGNKLFFKSKNFELGWKIG